MNSKYEVPESVVIVTGNLGITATLRFKDSSKDRILSANKKEAIYKSIEKYVTGGKPSVKKD